MNPVVVAHRLSKVYRRGVQTVAALQDVTLEILPGDFLAIVGPSGSGKSTLLNLLGCMDRPSSGLLEIAGQDVSTATERLKVEFRRRHVGFVFQHFGLMPTLTVEENIRLPHLFSGNVPHADIDELLERLALAHRRRHRPSELSGGEMQRTAIGRALFNKPKLLLADEPTGNLDSATSASILELFRELNAGGQTIVVVTHNPQLAASAKRRITLQDGRIV